MARTGTDSGLVLNLGCGRRRIPGALGVDCVALPEVDQVVDLERFPWPFADDSVARIYAYHWLEHVPDFLGTLAEIQRVCRAGARLHVEAPHYSCVGAFGDPTHRRFFAYKSFDQFSGHDESDPLAYTWATPARFRILRRRLSFGRAHRLLGIETWANRYPNLYENFCAYLFPARLLHYTLEVVK